MTFNPMRTLVGRMVVVTLLAVLLSNLIAFALFTNERGASLRRATESAVADQIAFSYQRIAGAAPERRANLTRGIRDFGIRYALEAQPAVVSPANGAAAHRIGQLLRERLGAPEVHVRTSVTNMPPEFWRAYRSAYGHESRRRGHRGDHEDSPTIPLTQVDMSIAVDGQWLNARAYLPGPRPAPLSVVFGGLLTIIVVGVGATLIARQIARPLADLANAARALGAGETNVVAPVRGPEDVRRASTAFNAMSERLGRQLGRQRQMLWALSHDLRTPITALKLRAELIEDEATRQRLLAPIVEMEKLTEQALSLARAGASDEKRSLVDIAEIVRTLCGELQDMGVAVVAEAPAPVMAECRPSEIARAVRNLAENAAKYGGGGIARVSRDAAAEVVIEVADNGPGVPEELRARLAEPFFRADNARSEAEGAGLGLAIAQAIADGHGGRLVLENRTPRGFSAKLILPT